MGGLRFTGITPRRYKKPTKQTHIEVNCVKCGVTIDTVADLDGDPVEVVGCPNCKTIFHRVSGKVIEIDNNGA